MWLLKGLIGLFCCARAAGDGPCDAANERWPCVVAKEFWPVPANESSAQGVRYIEDFCCVGIAIICNCGMESNRGGGDLVSAIAGHAGVGRSCGTQLAGVCTFWWIGSGPTSPSLFLAQQKIMMPMITSKKVSPIPLITMPQFLSPSSQNATLDS